MKITDVKATTLQGYKDWNYVRVETDEGIMGWGEAHPGEGISGLVVKRLKPLLLGKDPLDVEPLYTHMIDRTVGQSVGGAMLGAIGGVETALWDIAGKALGVPIYRLLGGKYRERIRLYADVGRGRGGVNTPQTWAERAREGGEDGFEALKLDIDHSADELQHDAVNRGLSLAGLDKMEAVGAGVLTSDELLRRYYTLVYAQTRNYQETARRLGVDGRTVKAKVDEGLLGEMGAI